MVDACKREHSQFNAMTKQLAVIREGGPLPFSRRSQGRPHFITHDARTDLQSTSKMLSVLGRDAATGPGAGWLDVVQDVTLRPAITRACRQQTGRTQQNVGGAKCRCIRFVHLQRGLVAV